MIIPDTWQFQGVTFGFFPVQTSMKTTHISLPLLASLMVPFTSLTAQTTKDGTRLEWRNDLTVIPNTISVNKVEYPAHTISIFEAEAGTAIDLWKADYTPISTGFTGKPLRATNVRLPQLSEQPIVVIAEASTEKKAGLSKLTLAFMANDSTPLADNGQQTGVVRDLAVKLNKAVVQAQIDRYQKDLDKVSEKHGSSQADVTKAQSKVTKTNSDLEKVKSKRSRIEQNNAKLHGEIAGLEKKFALSNDPKDLKKLTKARGNLAKNESDQAKLMTQEAKLQGTANKHQSTVESHTAKAGDHAESKEDLMKIVSELKRKQDQIR